MKTSICDICGNQANHKIKAKIHENRILRDSNNDVGFCKGWFKLDLCKDCYNKMIEFCRQNKD